MHSCAPSVIITRIVFHPQTPVLGPLSKPPEGFSDSGYHYSCSCCCCYCCLYYSGPLHTSSKILWNRLRFVIIKFHFFLLSFDGNLNGVKMLDAKKRGEQKLRNIKMLGMKFSLRRRTHAKINGNAKHLLFRSYFQVIWILPLSWCLGLVFASGPWWNSRLSRFD